MIKELSIIDGLSTDLAVIDSKVMAKISERMKEIDRANNSVYKKNTQATSQLMTLTMMCDAPYRRLRQVLAQIDSKRNAIEDAVFKMRKSKIRLKRLREKEDELSQVRADELDNGFYRSKKLLEASLKELATYQDVYDEIKQAHNIPDDWDELNLEREEIENHIKMAVRNGLRDVLGKGTLGAGTLEYLEQFGIHPMTAHKMISDYVNECEVMMKDGKAPTVDSLYNFLDHCAEVFKDCHKAVMRRIGIDNLIKDEYLFQELRDTA